MVVKSFYEHVLAQIQTLTVVFGSKCIDTAIVLSCSPLERSEESITF